MTKSEMVYRTVSERLIDQGHRSMIIETVTVSPDSRHVAYLARAGKKHVVVVDDKEQRQYDRIEKDSLLFSPDGQRVAYVARDAKKRFVVVDEREEKHYDGIEEGSLIFSPDSRRVGYVARVGERWLVIVPWRGQKQFVVVDGREEKQYKRIEKGSLLFSTDSQRLGYVADDGVAYQYRLLVVDGQEKEQYHVRWRQPFRSPDLRLVAYHETDHRADPDLPVQPGRVVVRGQESKWYDEGETVASVVFSPDSQRLAYAINDGGKLLVVVDGQQGEQYDRIEHGSLLFSPDSQQLAYVARRAGEWFVVVDGQEQEVSDGVEEGSLGL